MSIPIYFSYNVTLFAIMVYKIQLNSMTLSRNTFEKSTVRLEEVSGDWLYSMGEVINETKSIIWKKA